MKRMVWQVPLVLVLGIGAGGCGETRIEQTEVFPVQGELFVGAQPAAGAMVTLHPVKSAEPTSLRSMAVVDAAGKFALSTYVAGDGAPPGEFVLTAYWPDARRATVDADGEVDQLPPDMLGGRFASPDRSPLRVRVEERPNRLVRLDLKENAIQQADTYAVPAASP